MRVVVRTIAGAVAGLAAVAVLASPMAEQAEAATTIVRIQNLSTDDKVLSKMDFDGIVMTHSITRSRWTKTDVGGGYATYRNVFSDKCLSFRRFENTGFESVADRTCNAGDANQQWKLGAFNELILKANGRTLEAVAADPFTNNKVQLSKSPFVGQLNQTWKLVAG